MRKINKKGLVAAASLLIFSGSVLAVPVVLDLLTDDFAGETSFEMAIMLGGTNIAYDSWSSPTDLTGGPFLDDGFVDAGDLLSATDYTFTWDLDAGDYEFTIFDAFADGICCGFGIGSYTLTVDGVVAGSGGEFGAEETTAFNVAAVSEPGTFLLFAIGLMALVLGRRKI